MARTKHKPRVGYQDGGAIPPPIPVADPGAGAGPTTGTVGGATPPPIPIADPGAAGSSGGGNYNTSGRMFAAPRPAMPQASRRMRRGMRRGYQDGGEVAYDESVPQPILRPKPRPEAPDDTIYPTTAPDWGDTGADPYQAAMAVGYARGGPVGAQGGSVQPGADINKRAALLAGLRKRYDAMIAMAQGALAHRDENAAVRFAQRAHDMVPDGKSLILHVQPDGNVLAIVHDPRGGEQSRHVMTPDQFHHYLVGPATSFDHVIENGVGHNLGIASGRPTPRQPDHPADPIHKVRQVLQHTRRMFGVDRIGQAPPRIGYAAGGPVRGYDDGGEVDDDQTINPALLAPGVTAPTEDDYGISDYVQQQRTKQAAQQASDQAQQAAQRASDLGSDEPAMQSLLQRYRPADRPADRPAAPTAPDEPVTGESGIGDLLSRAGSKLYGGIDERIRAQQAAQAEVLPKLWGSAKQALADYVNGTNAASPEELSQAKQNEANQNPNLSAPEVVQRLIAGPPDPNTSQLPTAEAPAPPAETTAPSTAGSATGYVQPAVDPLTQAIFEGRAGVKNAALPATLPAYSTLPPSEPMTPERAAALKVARDRLSDLQQGKDQQMAESARNAPVMERHYDPRTGRLTFEAPHYAPARAGGNDAAIQQKAAEAAMKSFTAEQQEFMRNARMKQTNSVPLSKDEQSALDEFNTQYLQHKRLLQAATPTSAPAAAAAAAPARAGAQPAGPAAPGKIWIHNATTGQFMQWPP